MLQAFNTICTSADAYVDLISEQRKDAERAATYNILGSVTGPVGNNAHIINNYFAPVESAAKEAGLSIEQIKELKKLFEKKDKPGLIERLTEFGVHTVAIIAGYSIMGLHK